MSDLSLNRPIKDPRDELLLFQRRARIGFVVIVLLMLVLVVRYFWLQGLNHEDFSSRSESHRMHLRPVAPNRGMIYDRRGRILAENLPAYRLEVVPDEVDDLPALLDELATIVELGTDDRERFERERRRYRSFDPVPLRFNLSEQEVARFAVNRHRLDGVDIAPYLARHYPYGDLLTHVLGYVGRIDEDDLQGLDAEDYRASTHIGKLGVEKAYENQLHGTAGLEQVETNARGRVLDVLERSDPGAGADLVLAIDAAVQQAAWDALGERTGSVVAMDPRDGSIIAMVSKPAFDPNPFVQGISVAAFQDILAAPGRPLFNRAIAGGYEPGSTLKPFVGLAGLELGVIGLHQRLYSNGEYYLPNYDRPYRDWKKGGHGWVTIHEALEQSVNSWFYHVAYTLGIDRMHDYLAQFGFGELTGIDMPGESPGLLPSRDWKRGRFNQPWYPGETVIAGIGQGFNVVTPLQLASALSALVRDGERLQPRLLYAAKDGEGSAQRREPPLALHIPVHDPANWVAVREGMRAVINGPRGTARDVALNADYVIAGKTGTAQQYTLSQDRERDRQREVREDLRDHALFVGFAPYDAPRIVISVVVDNGGAGSRIAAPIARATIDAWLQQEPGT
jgi:penicillin-binding protein 2